MKIAPRNRVILTIAGVALVVLALIAVLVYPQFQQLSSLNTELVDATSQAQAAKMRLDERRAFKDRAVETNAKWLRLMTEMPDGPDLPSLIIELQDAAFKSGVQLTAVSPSIPTQAGTYSIIPVTMTILGSWSDTVDFAQSLVKLERGIRFVSMTTRLTGSAGGGAAINAPLRPYSVLTNVGIEAYTLPGDSATSTVPAQ